MRVLKGKYSCFAFRRQKGGQNKCIALKEMLCRQGNGVCPFYKKKEEAHGQNKNISAAADRA